MSIFDRMGRVLSSNFNALLDKAEDPRRSLEQTLREMKEQIGHARKELVRAVAAERQLKSKVEQLNKDAERWEERARLAVETGDDELARAALAERRRAKAELERTEQLRAAQRGNALEMRDAWEQMQQKFRDFSARKSIIVTRVEQAKAGGGVEQLGGSGSAFEQFRSLEDRIEGVDDVFQAQREVDDMLAIQGSPGGMTRTEVELRFQELEGRSPSTTAAPAVNELDAELAELKQKVRIRIQ